MSVSGDSATVSVFVRVPPADAFEVFTKEIDRWWRTGPRFRIAGKRRGTIFFEEGVGGRMFETFELSTGPRTLEVGKVTTWDPPARLELEWRGVNFAPGESTEVELAFEPAPGGTQVTLVHRGFAALRSDHPVRHGQPVPAFIRGMGLWWGGQMQSIQQLLAG